MRPFVFYTIGKQEVNNIFPRCTGRC